MPIIALGNIRSPGNGKYVQQNKNDFFGAFCNYGRDLCSDTNRGECSCPWQLSVLGKADRPLLVISNRFISVKNILARNAVVFCACDIIQLFYVVF
jgi:hypothetical protein